MKLMFKKLFSPKNIITKSKNTIPEKERYYIQWHLTDNCNLHCKHCYQDDQARTMPYEKALELLRKLDDFFAAKKAAGENMIPQINLTGGEPLLYPELLSLIDQICARGWLWALLTNGTMTTPETALALQKRNPVFIQVSLEGPEEINDACRGKGSFEKILHSVDIMNEAGIKTLVSFTVTSANFRTFHETAAICRAHHAHKLWCDRYVGNDSLCLSTSQYQEFLTVLKEEREKSDSQTIISAERSLQFMAGGNGYICGVGKSLLVFLPDGTILPCRRLALPLGNIFQVNSLDQLLRTSSLWADLGRPAISPSCISCPDLRRCQGGAKCVTFAQTGRYHGIDVNCPRS